MPAWQKLWAETSSGICLKFGFFLIYESFIIVCLQYLSFFKSTISMRFLVGWFANPEIGTLFLQ